MFNSLQQPISRGISDNMFSSSKSARRFLKNNIRIKTPYCTLGVGEFCNNIGFKPELISRTGQFCFFLRSFDELKQPGCCWLVNTRKSAKSRFSRSQIYYIVASVAKKVQCRSKTQQSYFFANKNVIVPALNVFYI